MNLRNLTIAFAFSLSLFFIAPTAAGLVPIGPFAGSHSESWEAFPTVSGKPPAYLPNPTLIMGGGATVSNDFMGVCEPLAGVDCWMGTSGPAQVPDGLKAMQVNRPNQTVTITFSDPIVSFGAYWGAGTNAGSVGDPAEITVNFFDANNQIQGTDIFSYSGSILGELGDGILEWHGWSSSVPIKYLTYTEDYVVIDGLQANLVPEPATAMLLAILLPVTVSRATRRPVVGCR